MSRQNRFFGTILDRNAFKMNGNAFKLDRNAFKINGNSLKDDRMSRNQRVLSDVSSCSYVS